MPDQVFSPFTYIRLIIIDINYLFSLLLDKEFSMVINQLKYFSILHSASFSPTKIGYSLYETPGIWIVTILIPVSNMHIIFRIKFLSYLFFFSSSFLLKD